MTDIILAILVILIALAWGYWFGYTTRDIKDALAVIKARVDAVDQDRADTTPDIVVAKTPQQVREHKFDDDSESAIVDALTPKEMAERRKMRLAKEIDEADG